jgi:hypothetical protein
MAASKELGLNQGQDYSSSGAQMECVRGWFLPQTIHIVVPTMSSPITTQTITFKRLRMANESSPGTSARSADALLYLRAFP